jgi:hypothetical protein
MAVGRGVTVASSSKGETTMPETRKAPAKRSINWPVVIIAAVFAIFIAGVWVNSYRVSHAAAPITSVK